MGAYGQFCPVAKAMELLDERWTMLVDPGAAGRQSHVQRAETWRAADLAGAAVGAAPALHRAGVIERYQDGEPGQLPVDAGGQRAAPGDRGIGRWGIRWIPELGDEDLDPHLLMWDIHRNIDLDAVPPGRSVLRFSFRDVSDRQRLVAGDHGRGRGPVRLRSRPSRCRHRRDRSRNADPRLAGRPELATGAAHGRAALATDRPRRAGSCRAG